MAQERDLSAADQDRLTPDGMTPAEAGYTERQPADPARSGNYNPIAKDPADIQRDIQHTRAEMTETVDAISARFEPEYLKRQARDVVRSTARDAGSSMIDTLKDNPVPALLTAVGLGWLLTQGATSNSDRDRRDYEEHYFRIYGRYPDYRRAYMTLRDPQYGRAGYDTGYGLTGGDRAGGDGASDAGDAARDRVSGAADDARQRAGDLADQAGDRLHEAEAQAAYYGRRATSWLESQVNRNPLGVGAAALAAGALVGMAVPETRAENRLVGEQAEHLKREAKSAAEEKLDQAKTVASRVADEAKDKAEDVADQAKAEAKDLKDTAKDEAKKEGLDEPPKTSSSSSTSGGTSGVSTASASGSAPKVGGSSSTGNSPAS